MIAAVNKQTDGTINLTITIPWEDVVKAKEKVLENLSKQAQVPGFRKGKAPKKLVEEKIDPQKVRDEVLKEILPPAVNEALGKNNINPIITPEIQAKQMDDGKDWQFTALTCELPEIDLDNYKEAVQKVTAKSKIVLPGKEPEKPSLDKIIQALLSSVKLTVPSLIIEHEVNHLLSQLLSEVKSLGLTLEKYLASTGKTSDILREEYAKKATDDVKVEFILQKIAETEHITVDDKEIDETINKIKDEKERENLSQNRYLLARLVRQQKTLDFLTKL